MSSSPGIDTSSNAGSSGPAPSQEGSHSAPPEQLSERSGRPLRTKRQQVAVACGSCQKRKSRCDGKRPSCFKCIGLKLKCVYDANSNETRYQQLKRSYENIAAENKDLRFLFDALVRSMPTEAEEIRRRMKDSAGREDGGLRDLAKYLRDGEVLVPLGQGERDEEKSMKKES